MLPGPGLLLRPRLPKYRVLSACADITRCLCASPCGNWGSRADTPNADSLAPAAPASDGLDSLRPRSCPQAVASAPLSLWVEDTSDPLQFVTACDSKQRVHPGRCGGCQAPEPSAAVHLLGRGPPCWRAICFTQCLTQNTLREKYSVIFDQIPGQSGPAKFTYRINHHGPQPTCSKGDCPKASRQEPGWADTYILAL